MSCSVTIPTSCKADLRNKQKVNTRENGNDKMIKV